MILRYRDRITPEIAAALETATGYLCGGISHKDIPDSEVPVLFEALDRLGLYDEALDFVAGHPGSETGARTELVRKKSQRKRELLEKNYGNNLNALKKVFPELCKGLIRDGNDEIIIAGDERAGFILLKESDGKPMMLNAGTFEHQELMKSVEEKREGIESDLCVVFSDMVFADSLTKFAEMFPASPIGQETVMYVVEEDTAVFQAVMRLWDFSELVRARRFVPFVGLDFEDKAREYFIGNDYVLFPMNYLASARLSDRIIERFKCIYRQMLLECDERQHEVNGYYEAVSGEQWREHFSGEPLRIMFTTTIFSTFIQHSTNDLKRAMERLGHEAIIHKEPHGASRTTRLSTLAGLLSFQPDMIVQIDHHRHEYKNLYPPSLPFAAWMHDEMPEFADPKVFHERDFVFTVLPGDLIRTGHDPEKVFTMPIPACDEKFRPLKLSSEDMEKYGCEVAYVSNIPLISEIMNFEKGRVRGLNEKMHFCLRKIFESDINSVVTMMDYVELLEEFLDTTGESLSGVGKADYLHHLKTYGYGTMVMRVMPMEWIAAAGYSMNLYGRGWSEYEPLSRFARGPIENGEPLCRAYQAAKINISISVSVSMHPRVFECILSGGFPLVKHVPKHKDKLSVHDFFEEGREIEVFRSREDLLQKIDYYLKHEEERREMAERARKKTLEKYTYLKQAEFMIETVRKRIAGQTSPQGPSENNG